MIGNLFNQGKNQVRRLYLGVDMLLLGAVALLVLFGLLMVYSAGPKFAMQNEKPPDYYLRNQVIFTVIGMIAAVIASLFKYQYYQKLSIPLMAATIIALIAVQVIGAFTLGATRSLIGGSVRPSEVAKLVIVIYVSVWLYAKKDLIQQFSFGLFPLGLILGSVGALILLQPDLSAVATVMILGGLLFFLANGKMTHVGLVLTIGMVILLGTILVYPTARTRLVDYVNGLQNPLNASEHVQHALEAVINGGVFGVGIGRSSTKFSGLPVQITDSIFAVAVEETGLLGAALLISAYGVIVWRGMVIARQSPDQLGALLASGFTLWIGMEAMLNMAVMVNLLPHVGNALPFISYGGTSQLMNLVAIGIVINVSRQGKHQIAQERSQFSAVVDMRWRNGGRGVPRYVRSASPRK
ncbi:MAG TPA: FtsW/RodA/SpoVE family cell cycle protein [Anaerolineaceae bacterium]